MEVLLVEAFAQQAGKGNPAGVVMDARGLTDQDMRQIAAQVGASETAFLEQLTATSWRNRFFTPRSEVAICGHATIASFFLVSQQNRLLPPGHRLTYIQQTKAYELAVQVRLTPSSVWIGGTACVAGRREIALEAGAN